MDSLTLKWGTLKAWNFKSEAALAAAREYDEFMAGPSAIGDRYSSEQKEALCKIIDAVDCKEIYLEWNGEYVSKEKAKEYVRAYEL